MFLTVEKPNMHQDFFQRNESWCDFLGFLCFLPKVDRGSELLSDGWKCWDFALKTLVRVPQNSEEPPQTT